MVGLGVGARGSSCTEVTSSVSELNLVGAVDAAVDAAVDDAVDGAVDDAVDGAVDGAVRGDTPALGASRIVPGWGRGRGWVGLKLRLG